MINEYCSKAKIHLDSVIDQLFSIEINIFFSTLDLNNTHYRIQL